MTEKRFELYDVGSPYITRCGIESPEGDCYENMTECCEALNELYEENKKLRTLNYVNKEAVRLNNIKTVKIGNNDVDCENIDWKLLYELYERMIDFYYDRSGDLE